MARVTRQVVEKAGVNVDQLVELLVKNAAAELTTFCVVARPRRSSASSCDNAKMTRLTSSDPGAESGAGAGINTAFCRSRGNRGSPQPTGAGRSEKTRAAEAGAVWSGIGASRRPGWGHTP